MSEPLPMAQAVESLELAVKAIRAAEALAKELPGDSFELDVKIKVWDSGCIVGRVEMQDDFFVFVPNSDWYGGTVEAMG